jgi:caffeoyl-CoA O-methyltransferase
MELIEADALDVLHELEDVFDVVFLDAEKSQYEHYFAHARQRVEPGGVVVADNVLSHKETLESYSRARQTDPTLLSTTVPLDRGLELSVVLSESL